MDLLFRDEDHKKNYETLLQVTKRKTPRSLAVVYLIALDQRCFEHCRDLYDFYEDRIITDGLHCRWQWKDSKITTRLAFNLYDGYCTNGEKYVGSDAFEDFLPTRDYTPYWLFRTKNAPYYVEAIKIAFPKSFGYTE